MTADMLDLARRAVACKGWRFMGGMRVLDPIGPHPQRISDDDEGEASWRANYWLPDLTDPATLGCLLALVREVWGDPYLCCVGKRETGWRLDGHIYGYLGLWAYGSEAEALVAALEAAP